MAISDNIRGAGLMALAMSAFTVNDVCVKLLTGHVPLSEIIVLRNVAVLVVIVLAAWRTGALAMRISPADKFYLLLRALCEAGATYLFLTALMHMDIGVLSAVMQALPLTVTLGAALVLREAVGWRRLVAIGTGFVGVLMIIQPGGAEFTFYALYGIGAVLCATVRDLTTRRMSRDVPSLTATIATAAVVACLGGVLSVTDSAWVVPDARSTALILTAAGLICVAYMAIVMAMRVGEIGFVAPFRYTSLVVAVLAGVVLFGERPDLLTLSGMAIVVGSGLYTLWRERQLRRRIAARAGARGAPT